MSFVGFRSFSLTLPQLRAEYRHKSLVFASPEQNTTAGPKKVLSTYEFVDGPDHGP